MIVPEGDPFERESRGVKLHNVEIQRSDALFEVLNKQWVLCLRQWLEIPQGSSAAFGSTQRYQRCLTFNEVNPAGDRLSHGRQQVNGVPVWRSHPSMTATPSAAQGNARLLALGIISTAESKSIPNPLLT